MDKLFWDRAIFHNISATSIQKIEQIAKKEATYAANEVVIEEGASIDHICIILEGALKSTEYTIEGKELNSSYFFGGDAFPFYMVYAGVDSYFFKTIALKKSRVVWLPVEELIPLVEADPVFLKNILVFVAEYCYTSKMNLRCVQYRKVEQRLAFWLLYLNNGKQRIKVPISQEVLSDILHVNRSSLNQALHHLA